MDRFKCSGDVPSLQFSFSVDESSHRVIFQMGDNCYSCEPSALVHIGEMLINIADIAETCCEATFIREQMDKRMVARDQYMPRFIKQVATDIMRSRRGNKR